MSGLGLEIPKALLTIPSQGGMVNLPAVIVTLVITWLLSRGTKESKRVNNIMVLIKIGIVVLFICSWCILRETRKLDTICTVRFKWSFRGEQQYSLLS